MTTAVIALLGFVALAIGLSLAYLERLRVARPPIGVFNTSDLCVLAVGVGTAPLIYLALPIPVAGAVFGATLLGVLVVTLQPLSLSRTCRWLAALALMSGPGLAMTTFGMDSLAFAVLNNVLVIVCTVGVANLWVQTGMRTRHLLVLAAGLTVYDVIATTWLPITAGLMATLGDAPFSPVIFWPDSTRSLGLGLGDLVLAVSLVLVCYKGFGRRAALAAAVGVLVAVAVVLTAVATGVVGALVPTMVAVGPMAVAVSGISVRGARSERSMAQFLQNMSAQEPSRAAEPPRQRRLGAAVAASTSEGGGE